MPMSDDIVNAESRIRGLMDEHETFLGYLVIDETDHGWYLLVIREWAHPTVDGMGVLSERFAYLRKVDDGEVWVTSSDAVALNRRDNAGRGETAQALAELYAQVAARQRAAPGSDTEPATGSVVDVGE